MKKFIGFLLVLVTLSFFQSFAQIGVNFNTGAYHFAAVNYEIKGRLVPELRIYAVSYELALAPVVMYHFVNKQDIEFYSGLGIGLTSSDPFGVLIPIGLNLYPFENKKFGFQGELSPILGEANAVGVSLGIRYRFSKE